MQGEAIDAGIEECNRILEEIAAERGRRKGTTE